MAEPRDGRDTVQARTRARTKVAGAGGLSGLLGSQEASAKPALRVRARHASAARAEGGREKKVAGAKMPDVHSTR